MHSWRTLVARELLSASWNPRGERMQTQLEQLRRFFAEYDFHQPWNSPQNIQLRSLPVDLFRCPNDPSDDAAFTSYLAVTGEQTFWPPGRVVSLNDVRDGSSNTIMVIEHADSGILWFEPRDVSIENAEIRSVHTRRKRIEPGGHVLTGDGSSRYFKPRPEDSLLNDLLTIDGGEPIESW